ncbi:Secretory pathway calcium atpase [Strongyloides ratti]|uniref:Calcium-transporting ATPase n=1 Tax=Strongyloides ratti TaxID=34506 RepID=A0A090LJJ2_STRRB|nr:Secretory pathway calcium atpase [Strongyloides ratti]CEF67680.1 Secretory pathway calcium atpase [Strongyloides ratti]
MLKSKILKRIKYFYFILRQNSYQNNLPVGDDTLPNKNLHLNTILGSENEEVEMYQNLNAYRASQLSSLEIVDILKSNSSYGISQEEAKRRINYSGYNEFDVKEKESLTTKYVEQFKNPLILLLLGSAIVSILMKQYDDAVSITIAVIIVVTVGFIQEYKSEKTLEKLNKLVPPQARVIRDGMEICFLARELVPGDIVVLSLGDRVPADVRIIEATELHIDESSFTGENEPKCKHIFPIDINMSQSISHLENIGFMGTLVKQGHGKGIVIATGSNSQFGEVFKMMQNEESPKTPLQNSMDNLGKTLSFYSFAFIGVIFLIGLIQGRDALDMFQIGVSLCVSSIPEGLPIVVAVTLAIGVIRMANRNAIIKKLSAVESLGCVTVICSDKTGTLTKNEMTATIIFSADGIRADVSGVGFDWKNGDVRIGMEKVWEFSHPSISKVIEIGTVCNNATIVKDQILGQPTEGALIVLSIKSHLDGTKDNYVKPLNGGDEIIMMKGAVEEVLERCNTFLQNGLTPIGLSDGKINEILSLGKGLGSSGLRVIGMAYGSHLGNLCFVGMVGILDPPREGVNEAISVVQDSGVAVKMVTGDAYEIACNIGGRLGIYKNGDGVMSGPQIDTLSDTELESCIKSISIFYRTCPKHKLRIVKALQALGEIVAMTGDGVNDAVALKKSDIGISMGKSGTDVCKEASDMVLLDDNFLTIRGAIEEGKGVYHNITNFVKFQLSTSVAALSLIAISTLFHLENPLNPLQILLINIIMDGPPALSLGVEPVDSDIIKQKPRNVKEPLLNKELMINILLSASVIVIGTMGVFYIEMAADNIVTARDTTMTFTCFVFFDMWNALSCRSSRKMIWEIKLCQNLSFTLAVCGSITFILAIVYVPLLQKIFLTEALNITDLIFLAIMTSSVFIVNEIKKYFDIKKRKCGGYNYIVSDNKIC